MMAGRLYLTYVLRRASNHGRPENYNNRVDKGSGNPTEGDSAAAALGARNAPCRGGYGRRRVAEEGGGVRPDPSGRCICITRLRRTTENPGGHGIRHSGGGAAAPCWRS